MHSAVPACQRALIDGRIKCKKATVVWSGVSNGSVVGQRFGENGSVAPTEPVN